MGVSASFKGRVLIIDDEASLRQTLARILQIAGCETNSAQDWHQARTLLSEQTFDLVYLDLHLPEQDGIQILKEIRKRDPNLAVIMLTGFGTLQSAVDALRLGATDYLLKPFDPEVLVARTRVVLQEQAAERRKRDLRAQIAILQAELETLERNNPAGGVTASPVAAPASVAAPEARGRFVKLGRLILDLQARRATFGERVITLAPSAFDYLAVLANHSPEVVDYRTLVREAQHYQVSAAEARELAKWHVHSLRQSLEQDAQQPRLLLNVRGIGYRLLVE